MVRAPRWWIVDAHGHHVGRLASQIPKLLQVRMRVFVYGTQRPLLRTGFDYSCYLY